MHERTQRAIARLMFVGCCAVPTMVTLAIIFLMATPWYEGRVRRQIETEIARETGFRVSIGGFVRTAPSSIRIDELRLTDAETSREVAYVRQLDWVTRDDEVSILLRQPKLHSKTLPGAWRLVHDRFLCRPEHTHIPIRFAANDLTIADATTGGMTLTDVDAWIEPDVDAVGGRIQCMMADTRTGTPIEITFRRDRGGEMPSTDWTIDTHDNALPCSVLAKYVCSPDVNLGSDATFTGSIRWHLSRDDRAIDRWWIALTGDVAGISLDRVFEKQSHRLSGVGALHFDRCRIEPRRRIDIAGTVTADDGQIGRSLLTAANQNLGFDLRLPAGDQNLAFDRIAMRFTLNDTQLRLDGVCHTEVGFTTFPEGIVMHAGGYALVRSGPQTLPSTSMMAALAPAHSVMVPVSGQNAGLLDFLIPPSRPLPQDPEAMGAKIRTARDWSGGPLTEQPY